MQSIFFWLFIIVSALEEATAVVDPCRENILMDNLHRRHPNYTTALNEPNLCDYQLDEEAWYRFESAETNRMKETCVPLFGCGTRYPIWLNGSHPTINNPGPVNVSICVTSNNGDDCCGMWSSTVEVKFCEAPSNHRDHFYAYRLKNVPRCDMAYCAERVPIPDFIIGPPKITRYRQGCLCDARKVPCSQVVIIVENVYESTSLMCIVASSDKPNTVYKDRAKVLSATELECPLPPSPLSTTADSPVYTWNISVSNDGQSYSNQLQLTVYDSQCLDCRCEGDCQLKNGMYVVEGRCQRHADDTTACSYCETNASPASDESTNNGNNTVVIIACVVAALVLIVLIVIVIKCRRGGDQRERNVHSIQGDQENHDSSRSTYTEMRPTNVAPEYATIQPETQNEAQNAQNAVYQGDPNAVYQGDPNAVYQGDPNAVYQGDPNAVYQGDPNAVYQGDQNAVYQGDQNAVYQTIDTPYGHIGVR